LAVIWNSLLHDGNGETNDTVDRRGAGAR